MKQKYHTSAAGTVYEKTVKNPFRQVRRQIDILARYLDAYGVRVWVEGYVFLLRGNSPVSSPRLLSCAEDIDRAIHTAGRNHLDRSTLDQIERLLRF